VVLLGDPIHPRGRGRTEAVVGAGQGRHVDQVGQRMELAAGFPSCSLRYLPEFWGHGAQRRCVGHAPLRKFVLPRAAFALPGPGRPPFAGVAARMRPSASPAASAGAPVPLAAGLPRGGRFSEPAARASANARRAGGFGLGPPLPQWLLVDRQGPPRVPGHPHPPRRGHLPRRGRQLLAHVTGPTLLPSGFLSPWAPRDERRFSGLLRPRLTGSPAYASAAASPRGRQGWLPTCRAGLWSGGTRTRWMTDGISWSYRITPSFPTSIAWSHQELALTRDEPVSGATSGRGLRVRCVVRRHNRQVEQV